MRGSSIKFTAIDRKEGALCSTIYKDILQYLNLKFLFLNGAIKEGLLFEGRRSSGLVHYERLAASCQPLHLPASKNDSKAFIGRRFS